jgi:hypothetical protein
MADRRVQSEMLVQNVGGVRDSQAESEVVKSACWFFHVKGEGLTTISQNKGKKRYYFPDRRSW